MSISTVFTLIIIGLAVGSFTGAFGIGGGIILIPVLIYFIGLDQKTAQGTSIAIMLLPVGLFGFINYYKAGYVNIKYVLIISLFFMIGSLAGSKISLNASETVLRKVFGMVIFIISLKIIFSK